VFAHFDVTESCHSVHLSTLNPQPSTLNPQPSTLNPQPSTLNPQPSTLNSQPSTLNSQLSTLNLIIMGHFEWLATTNGGYLIASCPPIDYSWIYRCDPCIRHLRRDAKVAYEAHR
jgi:hypothetical protein